jgi:hypothetical protein
VEKISKPYNFQGIAWLLLAVLNEIYNEIQEQKETEWKDLRMSEP